jgi:hypothetical protein
MPLIQCERLPPDVPIISFDRLLSFDPFAVAFPSLRLTPLALHSAVALGLLLLTSSALPSLTSHGLLLPQPISSLIQPDGNLVVNVGWKQHKDLSTRSLLLNCKNRAPALSVTAYDSHASVHARHMPVLDP